MTTTDTTYTIRPAGCSAWAEHQSATQAPRAAEEARDAGLRRIIIVGEQTGRLYHVDAVTGRLTKDN